MVVLLRVMCCVLCVCCVVLRAACYCDNSTTEGMIFSISKLVMGNLGDVSLRCISGGGSVGDYGDV